MTEANETTDVTEVTQPTSFIGDDGTFTEGWRDKYVPADVRKDAVFDRATTIQGVMKSLASAERMIGADKIVKPNDKFGDSDWDEYHKAGGWTGEPIPLAPPEDLPEGIWSDERATKFSGAFNDLRLTPKQVAGLTKIYNEDLIQQVTDLNNNSETAKADLKAGLLADWGNAYAQKEHNGNVAVEKGVMGDAEFKERLLQKFGNDPDFIRFASNLGGEFGESGGIPPAKQTSTPDDIESKIDEIYKSEAFSKPAHPGHKDAMANLKRLYKEKNEVRQPAQQT